MKSFYDQLRNRSKKRFALLVDPDKYDDQALDRLIFHINQHPPDLILVGGSLLFKPIDITVTALKLGTHPPVFVFPGNVIQLSDQADGILFLSLISGRNPEFLIGNHVLAAPHLNRSGIEIIPTGYMFIENGKSTSVEYMSNTRPIPAGKPEIAVAHALTAEYFGMKYVYLEDDDVVPPILSYDYFPLFPMDIYRGDEGVLFCLEFSVSNNSDGKNIMSNSILIYLNTIRGIWSTKLHVMICIIKIINLFICKKKTTHYPFLLW